MNVAQHVLRVAAYFLQSLVHHVHERMQDLTDSQY